jgi:hypothetical protein
MSNPRVDESMAFVIPQMGVGHDPETGQDFAVDDIPTHMQARVADPTSPDGSKLVKMPMRSRVITPASEADRRRYLTEHTCLTCRFFDHTNGQAELRRPENQFFDRLIKEHNWDESWLGVPKEQYGICGMDTSKVVSPISSCDQWRASRGSYNFHMGKKPISIGAYTVRADHKVK